MSIDIACRNEARLEATAEAEGVSVDAYVEVTGRAGAAAILHTVKKLNSLVRLTLEKSLRKLSRYRLLRCSPTGFGREHAYQ